MQAVKTWRNSPTSELFTIYLEELIDDGYIIEQVIIGKYTGNAVFKVIDNAVILCSRSAYHEEEQQQ